METQNLNLFIIDSNTSLTEALGKYLKKRFGRDLQIFTFSSGESALKMVDKNTGIVIVDYNLKGINGNEVLEKIKQINPKTKVILLSSNEEISVAIEAFRNGASDFVHKGAHSWKKVEGIVLHFLTFPLRLLVKEFGISKYFAIFIMTFITVGVVVYFTMNLIKQ